LGSGWQCHASGSLAKCVRVWEALRRLFKLVSNYDYSRVQINREQEFALWAKAFGTLQQKVKTVYGYFNNHFQGHSPASANQFKRLLGQSIVEPSALENQPSLF
jgi:uncharacterized protein YecE (DUF72 family)